MTELTKYLRPEVIQRIAPLELRARRIVEGFIAGLHRSPYQGFSVEFAQHREYVPGDDIRHIDWRVYGRADRYYVKQYEEETNLKTYILLDASRSMAYPEHAGAGRMTKFEYASCVAASLAYLLMEQQDAAGLVLFDHQVREQIPPTAQKARLRSLIELIDRSRPDDTTDVKILFTHLAERIRRRGMIVIVSDLLTLPEDVIDGLQRFRYGGHEVLVLHILDHDEIHFPFPDNTLFEGMERPELQLLTDPQSLRRSYLAALERFVSRIRGTCVNQRIDYALISTRDPLDVALSAFLAQRMRTTK
jgi:uncharacterized protein (DUF58 family)